jgi:NADH dehydrogenase
MRIALIGGTGFVGRYLVDALLAGGHAVSLLVRSGSEIKLPEINRCRVVTGDLASRVAIDKTLEKCDAVIYNVGILRELPGEGITFEALQYDGLVSVVDAARDAGISRFLLMSANGVIEDGTRYQQTKYRAEVYAKASGLELTIFRPSVIFGDPRGAMEFATQLYRDMVRPPLPAVGFFTGLLPGHGQIAMSPVHVEDVAQAFCKALEDHSTIGKTFVLGGPETLSWTEMLQRIARRVGRDKWILPMPIGLMKVAAAALDWLPFFPVTRDQLTMLASGNTAEPKQLESLIGRKPRSFDAENLGYLGDGQSGA